MKTECPMVSISELVEKIREIKKTYPLYNAMKVKIILERECKGKRIPSRVAIYRIINKYRMYYSTESIKYRNRVKRRIKKDKEHKRIPYMTRATSPGEIIEFDMKHINLLGGVKLYAMCGIDQFTKKTMIHITSSPSSKSTIVALEKIVETFERKVKIFNDI